MSRNLSLHVQKRAIWLGETQPATSPLPGLARTSTLTPLRGAILSGR